MFTISEKASEMIKENFKNRETLPSIRLLLSAGG